MPPPPPAPAPATTTTTTATATATGPPPCLLHPVHSAAAAAAACLPTNRMAQVHKVDLRQRSLKAIGTVWPVHSEQWMG